MKKLLILIIAFTCSSLVYSQTSVEYEVVYNSNTGLYEAYAHVIGDALTFPSNISGTAGFTIVLPTGVIPAASALAVTTVNPLGGPSWSNSNTSSGPMITPGLEYRFISKSASGTFTSFADGDDILLFTFSLGGSCVGNVRVFNNDTDPNSAQLGTGNYSNSFQNFVVGELYTGNRNNDGTACIFIQDTTGPWDVATNWVDDQVPTVNDDAIIAANVISTVRQDQPVKSLVLEQGTTGTTTVTVDDTFTLTIKEDVENNGVFVGEGEVLLDGTENQNLSGTGDYENVRVNNSNGVDVENGDLTDPTAIIGVLYVETGNFTTNDNTLFPCSFAGVPGNYSNGRNGQIGPLGGTITGDVQVEQCYPARRAFRFVSSSTTTANSIRANWQENADAWDDVPVDAVTQPIPHGYGTHITGVEPSLSVDANADKSQDKTDGLDWQPSGNASLYSFNTANSNWDMVLKTQDDTTPTTPNLVAGQPYRMLIRGDRSIGIELNNATPTNTKLRSTGTALKGDVTFSDADAVANGYVFFGNPFHSIVDMQDVLSDNTDFTGFYTVWDPTIGGSPTVGQSGGRGGYVTYSLALDMSNAADSETDQYLQAYQGFFLQSTVANPSVTFSEADKAPEQTQLNVFSTTPSSYINISLYDQLSYDNNDTQDDGVVMVFTSGANNGIDANDAPKYINTDENMARREGNDIVSIEHRDMPQVDEVLDLFMIRYRTTNYVFSVEVGDFPNHTVYLYDKYTATYTLLDTNAVSTYNFSIDESVAGSVATDRFDIRFQNTTLGTNTFTTQDISVYPNPTSDILNINFGQSINNFETLEMFDVTGKLVKKINLTDNQLQEVSIDVNGLSSGVYILNATGKDVQFNEKVIVE